MGYSVFSMGYNKKTLSYPGPASPIVHSKSDPLPKFPSFTKETSENWKMYLPAILKQFTFPALIHSVLGCRVITFADDKDNKSLFFSEKLLNNKYKVKMKIEK